MKFACFRTTRYLFAIALALPGIMAATPAKTCPSRPPTAESETWNFTREALNLLKEVQADAFQVQDHADKLRMFALDPKLSWEAHADQLSQIKQEVNDLGAKLCRLETIRRVAETWQQQAIDRTALVAREMTANADQAIQYLNHNREHLWGPAYRQYASNLFHEGRQLSDTVQHYEQLASVRQQEKQLEHSLTTSAGD